MNDAETQPADVDMVGTLIPPVPTAIVTAPNVNAQTPSASAASSGSAAPAVAAPKPNPDSNSLT
eukprot:14651926-Alexandrium_andersonii.AAC.1